MTSHPISRARHEKMYPANRVNRPPEWEDYLETARRMWAVGLDVDTSSLEECQQILADAQDACDRGLTQSTPSKTCFETRSLELSN